MRFKGLQSIIGFSTHLHVLCHFQCIQLLALLCMHDYSSHKSMASVLSASAGDTVIIYRQLLSTALNFENNTLVSHIQCTQKLLKNMGVNVYDMWTGSWLWKVGTCGVEPPLYINRKEIRLWPTDNWSSLLISTPCRSPPPPPPQWICKTSKTQIIDDTVPDHLNEPWTHLISCHHLLQLARVKGKTHVGLGLD